MSNITFNNNNITSIYHADFQLHKGKTMNKHNHELASKKIIQFKKKNNIGSDKWISSYDVHKSNDDKKRKHIYAKNMRSKGYDYKFFVTNNEIGGDQNQDDEDLYVDCDWDYYSDYDYREYRNHLNRHSLI